MLYSTFELTTPNLLSIFGNMNDANLLHGGWTYYFEFSYKDGLTSCLVKTSHNTSICKLDYTDGSVILYNGVRMIPPQDLTMILNVFLKFHLKEVVTNLRANIIEAVRNVPVV